jgi:hypothetical protein
MIASRIRLLYDIRIPYALRKRSAPAVKPRFGHWRVAAGLAAVGGLAGAVLIDGGTTPLMAAAGINWVVNQTFDEGSDALLAAVKLARALGNDVNAVNSMGLRAIHGAANRGSNAIIEYLVANGAELDVADREGRTPMDWAEGVFLATHPPVRKPETIAALDVLGSAQ